MNSYESIFAHFLIYAETSLIFERIWRCSHLVRGFPLNVDVRIFSHICEKIVLSYNFEVFCTQFVPNFSNKDKHFLRFFYIIFITREKITTVKLSGNQGCISAYPACFLRKLQGINIHYKYQVRILFYCSGQWTLFQLVRTWLLSTEGGCCPFINMEMSGMCLLGPYQLPQTLNTWCWCSISPPIWSIIYFKKKTGFFKRMKLVLIGIT